MPRAKKNGKSVRKINGTDFIDPASSSAHPDIVKFAQTLDWIRSKYEKETKPQHEELRQRIELMLVHQEEATQHMDNINNCLSSVNDDDDPVIHILDVDES
jgi:hypothetical protein